MSKLTDKDKDCKKDKDKECECEKHIQEEKARVSEQNQKLGKREIDKEDYESEESFPASDPPANY